MKDFDDDTATQIALRIFLVSILLGVAATIAAGVFALWRYVL